MTANYEYKTDIAWCPGCGNFNIHKVIISTFQRMSLDPHKIVMVSGIGQAAKMPQYLDINYFNGLHGRALPVATAVKASNPELLVIAEGGDGDMYGEGGNHFMHTIRRNTNIVNIVHNNMVYGLTKGQASPTSQRGFKTPLQLNGVSLEPANPLGVALAYGATFVARAFSNDREQLQEMLEAAINHKGYALIDVFQPCVSFNKVNNHKWFKENTYYIDDKHDKTDMAAAFKLSTQKEKLPLGIFYREEGKPTFEDHLQAFEKNKDPLFKRTVDMKKAEQLQFIK